MSDLISRKALLEDMRNAITESSDTLDWINLINKQPTAYDVDDVLKQIRKSIEITQQLCIDDEISIEEALEREKCYIEAINCIKRGIKK